MDKYSGGDYMGKNQDDMEKVTFAYDALHEATVLGQNVRYQDALFNVKKELGTLDLNRGGGNTSGFVFENLHVASKNAKNIKAGSGNVLNVIDDNGIADFSVTDLNGNVMYQQAKMGYHGSNKYKITGEKYGDQTLVVDKGNSELIDYGERIGLTVEESSISKKTADRMTAVMKKEGEIRSDLGLSNTAPITSNLYTVSQQMKHAHGAGVKAAKGSAAFTAGVSFGKNMYELMEGNAALKDVVLDTGKDAAMAAGGAYVTGSAGYLVSGAISQTAVGTVMTQASGLLVSTQIGSTIVSLGPVFATMSAAVGPAFVAGMVLGTGCAVVKSVKVHSNKYKAHISQVNQVLDQVLLCMKSTYDDLDADIKETYNFWDQSFEEGFCEMLDAIQNNDFNRFADGLDIVVGIFDKHVLFHSMEEFDEFFFDENAVLTL